MKTLGFLACAAVLALGLAVSAHADEPLSPPAVGAPAPRPVRVFSPADVAPGGPVVRPEVVLDAPAPEVVATEGPVVVESPRAADTFVYESFGPHNPWHAGAGPVGPPTAIYGHPSMNPALEARPWMHYGWGWYGWSGFGYPGGWGWPGGWGYRGRYSYHPSYLTPGGPYGWHGFTNPTGIYGGAWYW